MTTTHRNPFAYRAEVRPRKTHYNTIILGAGFSGICMAVQLLSQSTPQEDFLILEKGLSVGGTWYENQYPGAECDVESHLYSFSFFPKANWSRIFSNSQEIYEYVCSCVTFYQLQSYLYLKHHVTSATFNETTNLWELHIHHNDEEFTVTCQYFVCSFSPLHFPSIPSSITSSAFVGPVIHTAQWSTPTGPNIAVIGNAASGVQLIPELAKDHTYKQIYIFQRTPNWIIPKFNRNYTSLEKILYTLAPLRWIYRQSIYLYHESFFNLFYKHNWISPWAERLVKCIIGRIVKDPKTAQALMPSYPMGCKRILLSDNYLPTYNLPHVHLITTPIESYGPDYIRTTDGKEYPAQSIVAATGFETTGAIGSIPIAGRNGQQLFGDRWTEFPETYYGVHVDGFPNLFLLAGPNTGSGHMSVISYSEAQVAHVLKLMQTAQAKQCTTIEVKATKVQEYIHWLVSMFPKFVWDQCKSWYLYKGANASLFPASTSHYLAQLHRVSADDFDMR